MIATGDRQITEVHLPGDIIGWSGIASTIAMDTISALSDCRLHMIDLGHFNKLVSADTSYAYSIIQHLCLRHVSISNRLTSLGLQDAAGRVAAFICEIHVRLSGSAADILKFELCMSQPDIGEATGLTGVHINRVLRRFREANVMTISKAQVSIHDLNALRKIAMLAVKDRALQANLN
jgi:CRP/FNR family transcriptional regulator